LQATQKNSEFCPSNQVSAAAITSASEEKWRSFNYFFKSDRVKDLSGPLYTIIRVSDQRTAKSNQTQNDTTVGHCVIGRYLEACVPS